jgi:hypothetical protein
MESPSWEIPRAALRPGGPYPTTPRRLRGGEPMRTSSGGTCERGSVMELLFDDGRFHENRAGLRL